MNADELRYHWIRFKVWIGLEIGLRDEMLLVCGRMRRLAKNLTEDDLL